MNQLPDDLKSTLDAHRVWVESGRQEGQQAMLSGMDLRFIDLSNTDFSGAVLDGANLERSSLRGCKFVGASLQRANLSLAQLDGSDFSGANLTGANLSDTASVHSFGKANLAGAILQRARFPESDFTSALLEGADLGHAMLEGANFSNANLMSAKLYAANLQGAILDRAMVDSAVFERAILRKASLCELHGELASFRLADLTECLMERSHLALSTWDRATLSGARLVHSSFDGASLIGTTLSRVTIEHCSFLGADFTDAVTAGVDFTSAQLEGAKNDPTARRRSLMRKKLSGAQRRWLFRKDAGSGAWAAPSSMTVSHARELEQQLLTLTRTRDELQQSLQRQARQGQLAESERSSVESTLAQITDQCKLLENQIARGNERARKLQEELRSRVALAVDALMIVAKPLDRAIGSLRIWAWTTALLGTVFLGLAAWRAGIEVVSAVGGGQLASVPRPDGLTLAASSSYWLVVELVLIAAGLVSWWLASKTSRRLSYWMERRERIQKCIAALVASQYIDFEMDAKQSNVTRTFEAVRASLLDVDDPSEQTS